MGTMAARLRRLVEALLLGLVAVGFGAAASGGHLGLPLCAAVGVALLFRAGLMVRGLQPRVSRRWEWSAYALYAPMFAWQAYAAWPGFRLLTWLNLLLFVGVVKLFTCRDRGDYLALRILAGLEILTAATMAPPAPFLVFLLLFVALMVASIATQEVYASQLRSVVGAGPSPAKADAPLMLSAAGRAESASDAPAAMRLTRSLAGFSLVLSASVVALAAGIFFLLPRTTLGGAPPAPGKALTGFSDEVELGAIGSLQQSDTPVMHIRIADSNPTLAPPAIQRVLWRGRALSHFDGKSWTIDAGRVRLVRTAFGQVVFPERDYPETPHQMLRYQVTLAPLGTPVLFFPARLQETWTQYSSLAYDHRTDTVSASGGENVFGGTSYSGLSDIGQPPPELLRQAPLPGRSAVLEPFLQYPELDPRIRALAAHITAGDTNNWDRMQALSNYLANQYSYTLTDLPQGADPLSEFLFTRRAGDCEYFATALAMMGRSLGIPTRLVNGFMLGPYNPISGEYIVAARQAHSWIEAYFPEPDGSEDGTWIPLDATPPAEPGADAGDSRASMMLDAMASLWQEWVVSYDWMHQAALFHQAGFSLRANAAAAGTAARAWIQSVVSRTANARMPRPGLAAGAGLLLALMAGMGWLAWRRGWYWRPHWRRAPRDPEAWAENQARRLYRSFQRALQRAGYKRNTAETADELVARLGAGPAREHAVSFVAGYQRLRFGPLPSEAAVEQCRRLALQLEQFRRGLRGGREA